jgi:hypothetical protein
VLENPWVMVSLRKHLNRGAWLNFNAGASMSEKALRIFVSDMQKLKKDELAKEVATHRKELALLSYYGNDLILFPDHHAILWRWNNSIDLFQWPAASMKTDRCTDYPMLNVGCAGVVIESDGSLRR